MMASQITSDSLLNRLLEVQITENIKAPRHWLCEGNSPVMHTTELARNRTAGLCAARWFAARLCVIWLGWVEVHP